jgi:hypothetical protein
MSIENADIAGSRYSVPYPRLRLKQGDRAHFVFMTTGNDDYFDGALFHRYMMPGQRFGNDVVCKISLTKGQESCVLCEEGYTDRSGRFAAWVYVFDIYHRLAPVEDDEEAEAPQWEQVEVIGRILYRERVNQPLLIWLPYGRKRVWFNQFRHEYDTRGKNLADKLYELLRKGSGRDDTDYKLTYLKDMKTPAEVKEAAENIIPIRDIFLQTASLIVGPAVSSNTLRTLSVDDDEDEPVVLAKASKRKTLEELLDTDEDLL